MKLLAVFLAALVMASSAGAFNRHHHYYYFNPGHHYGQAKKCVASGGHWLNIPPLFPAGCYEGWLR